MTTQHPQTPSSTGLLAAVAIAPVRRLGSAWEWLRFSDPTAARERTRNHALAVAVLLSLLLATQTFLGTTEPAVQALLLSLIGVTALALWLQSPRAVLLASAAVIGITLLAGQAEQLLALDQSPGLYDPLIPVVLAALFVSPRAGVWACGLQIGVRAAGAFASGAPLAAVGHFLLFGSASLWTTTALLAVGAALFNQTLQRSLGRNAELERQVQEHSVALASAQTQLLAMREQIARAAEQRVRDLAETLHAVRNHLSSIRGTAELLALDLTEAGLCDTSQHMQQAINASLQAQHELLETLLEAAMLEAGTLELRPKPTDLAQLVSRAAEHVRKRYEHHRCALAISVADGLPAVRCDERRIGRVVQYLLENAFKYTAPYRRGNGVVQVTLERDEHQVVLRVADNGPGIPRDRLARLEQRLDGRAEGEDAVAGLRVGLFASSRIVALHGGSLRLTSEGEGSGVVAEVRLPIEIPETA